MAETPAAPTQPTPAPAAAGPKRKRVGGTIVGAIFGFIFGVGLAILLSQYGVVDMVTKTSLVWPAAFLVGGALIGYYGGRPRKTPPS